MSEVGTEARPLRVAIVGAGPSGFYVAEQLYKQKNFAVEVDIYDRLPTPYGLVRAGVAPDHQKIKSVTKIFERVAMKPGFRFFGYVELGKDVEVADLRHHYHQIVYTTGAQTDRHLNVPGIDLGNSFPATEFVAWYNGHPDYRDFRYDLSQERVAVIGVGNVAVDVARILCRSTDELATTDIADYALEALSESRVKDVFMLGRRGPAQGAFTSPEVKELGELPEADVIILPEEADLDALSQAAMADADRGTMRKVQLIQEFAMKKPAGKPRRLHLRFLVSPTELIAGDDGNVSAMTLVHNELYATEAGTLRSRPIEKHEELSVGLVFRSIGYRGVPLPGVPFNESWGVILNADGRVLDPGTQKPRKGEFTAGWIKRGPTGVIGTNKPDAAETVDCMLADVANGHVLDPPDASPDGVEQFIRDRQPAFFSFDDWRYLNDLELARGEAQGRPRVKITAVEEMIAARAARDGAPPG
jgi:ferredoxin--NADP+ reductase